MTREFTDWKQIVLNPRVDVAQPEQLFDDTNVVNVQIWFGATGPMDHYALRFRTFVKLSGDAIEAVKALGRNPEEVAWPTYEEYTGLHISRYPEPSSPWRVMAGGELIADGFLLQINQQMVGRVKCEILQTEGQRRLLLYRLVRQR